MYTQEFYVHVNVHRKTFLFNKTNRRTNFPKFILSRNSTYFGQFLCLSLRVFHCTFGTGICHANLMTAFKHDWWSCLKLYLSIFNIHYIRKHFQKKVQLSTSFKLQGNSKPHTIEFLQRQEIFSTTALSRPALGHHLASQSIGTRVLSRRIHLPGREGDNSPPSMAQDKAVRSYNSATPYALMESTGKTYTFFLHYHYVPHLIRQVLELVRNLMAHGEAREGK